ncbi:hypothetical protein E2C01_065524 [Portunus trituberculatus]|uniref:Uncharacterized protein n=1 Tax=Portunus trituberculatus TaxID=210409 RepID=A0A5B7HJ29_PORTR|nr:hypothetical protein [Portunus trituberculatus]
MSRKLNSSIYQLETTFQTTIPLTSTIPSAVSLFYTQYPQSVLYS